MAGGNMGIEPASKEYRMDEFSPTFTLSTSALLKRVVHEVERHCPGLKGRKIAYLDIGAGTGDLINLVSHRLDVIPHACDYTDELMQLPGQKVDTCNLNTDPLPYADNSFDLVTFTEVIEHVEHHQDVLREIHRVLRPDGYLIVTTPNILNIKSRLRFLFFGFWNLFGPLYFKDSHKYTTGGHINPISYFYVAHSLLEADFRVITEDVDKRMRSGVLPFLLLYLPIRIAGFFALKKEVRKYRTVDDTNREHVLKMNSPRMLLGRTLIVVAQKPRPDPA
jgi:ubiquinone/menaquinone biosynthesis C-methylase UbiE